MGTFSYPKSQSSGMRHSSLYKLIWVQELKFQSSGIQSMSSYTCKNKAQIQEFRSSGKQKMQIILARCKLFSPEFLTIDKFTITNKDSSYERYFFFICNSCLGSAPLRLNSFLFLKDKICSWYQSVYSLQYSILAIRHLFTIECPDTRKVSVQGEEYIDQNLGIYWRIVAQNVFHNWPTKTHV